MDPLKSLWSMRRYIRLDPFDSSTEDGRRNERYRRAALTTVAGLFSRSASLALVFVSLRVALPYLGAARFGVWMTISSMSAVLLIFDFGIGNSLVSRVAGLTSRADTVALRDLVTTGLAVLALLGIIIGGALLCAAAYAPLDWLYKGAEPPLIDEARRSLMLFAILFGLSIPLQATHRIYAGLQQGYFSQSILAIICIGSVALLPFLPGIQAGVPMLLLCTYGAQVASGGVLLVHLATKLKLISAAPGRFGGTDIRRLLGSGGLFFVLQIAAVIGWNMDSALLSSLIGPTSVAVYSVVQRLFMLVTVPLALLNGPLWASYADAVARSDVAFLRRTLRISLLGTFVIASLAVILILMFLNPLSNLLMKHALHLPWQFVLLFGLWTIVNATGDALATYLNGVHILIPQVVTCALFCVLALSLKLILISTYGLTGLATISLVSYLGTFGLLYTTVFRGSLAKPLYLADRHQRMQPINLN